jgi:IS5 family transposase
MRRKRQKQVPLAPAPHDHQHAKELDAMDIILRDEPVILDLAMADLVDGDTSADMGAPGLTADFVVRAAVLKQMLQVSYLKLAHLAVDSLSCRKFLGLGLCDEAPKKSALQENIKKLTASTWEEINKVLVGYARRKGIERGSKARIDCTVTDTDIHEPDDAAQLWDTVRVLTRLLDKAREAGFTVAFSRRTKAAKRRRLGVMNAKNKRERRRMYRALVKLTEEVLGFADDAVFDLRQTDFDPVALGLASELEHYAELGRKVVSQTRRRVFDGEAVPASEKVVSIFEPHTDIIAKGNRKVQFGHKLCLCVGESCLVLDLVVEKGNPADSTMVERSIHRLSSALGRVPRQIALDGGFASKANLQVAKEMGVKDVCFSKGRGLAISDMVKSTWVYKQLRRFRAGIEAVISYLKRGFGLRRCTWKGEDGFEQYAWASVVSFNLLLIARNLIE